MEKSARSQESVTRVAPAAGSWHHFSFPRALICLEMHGWRRVPWEHTVTRVPHPDAQTQSLLGLGGTSVPHVLPGPAQHVVLTKSRCLVNKCMNF